jgi:hypothetical protein
LLFSDRRTVRIYIAIAAILIILGSFLLFRSLSAPSTDGAANSLFISVGSAQWTGYVTMSSLLFRQDVVTGVNGSWTVPAVTNSQDDVYSAIWVGIGGYGESTLIQTGTLQGIRNGKIIYYAWYELLPNTAVQIHSLHVEPGDKMEASVTLIEENKHLWLIEISDLTKNETYKRTFSYTSSRLSAEWIVERPSIGGKITTLANFGAASFSNCQATINNVTGSINHYPGYRLTMYDDNGELVSVSPLTFDGSGFTVSYLGAGGKPPHQ